MVKSKQKLEVKAVVLTGMAYEQEPELKDRKFDTLYSCEACGKIYKVYRGEIECSCMHRNNGY